MTEPSASCPLVRSAESPEACSVRVSVARSGGPFQLGIAAYGHHRSSASGFGHGKTLRPAEVSQRDQPQTYRPPQILRALITQCDAHS